MKKTILAIALAIAAGFSSHPLKAQIVDRELTNLVIFIRFADDAEITHDFPSIDSLFNGKTPDFFSVANFYDALTYGHIHYRTVYTNNIQNNQIVSYQDVMPRGYFEPYSPSNPIGYTGENPIRGISMREAELLARAFSYVDSNHLVNDDVVLDGNGDGYIDNVSFVVKGGTGAWASILWPHMEYFPHDSIDHVVQVNGVRPNTFNFEFEGSSSYFTANVFCHEMGHSLNLPDLYHYVNYTNVRPVGTWDMMEDNTYPNHTAAILKSKILHVCDAPIQITADGDYTLNSVGSSQSQNCYYIKSAIDTTQWYVLEYRRYTDPFDMGVPGCGLIVARWNDTVPLNYDGMFANALFDNQTVAHQYWIFRPGANDDIHNGQLYNAHFCQAEGRTTFGPSTNPHPYLTDGTPEVSFEITDIHENGEQLTFHVHFFRDGIDDAQNENVAVYPNPVTDRLFVEGEGVRRVEIFNSIGQQMALQAVDNEPSASISMSDFPAGIYVVRILKDNNASRVMKVVKK